MNPVTSALAGTSERDIGIVKTTSAGSSPNSMRDRLNLTAQLSVHGFGRSGAISRVATRISAAFDRGAKECPPNGACSRDAFGTGEVDADTTLPRNAEHYQYSEVDHGRPTA